MIDKNFLSLDLELNQPSGSIIQVGYVIGNLKSGEIFQEVCDNIKVEEEINPFITNLTGITQKDVDNGIDIRESYANMCDFHKEYNCFRNNLQWGQGDSECLERLVRKEITEVEWFLFGRRSIDVKTVFISYRWANGLNAQAGLAKALNKLGFNFEGKKHNSLCDAKNTFIIYRELLKKFSLDNKL